MCRLEEKSSVEITASFTQGVDVSLRQNHKLFVYSNSTPLTPSIFYSTFGLSIDFDLEKQLKNISDISASNILESTFIILFSPSYNILFEFLS